MAITITIIITIIDPSIKPFMTKTTVNQGLIHCMAKASPVPQQ